MTDYQEIPDYADPDSSAYDQADRPLPPDHEPALPADRPLGIDEYGVTAEEQRHDEPLGARLVREEPELAPVDSDRVGRLVAPDEGAHEDTEAQAIGYDSGEFDDQSAEEAAMHAIPDGDADALRD